MIFPGFPGVPSFFQVFQVFQVEWEPCNLCIFQTHRFSGLTEASSLGQSNNGTNHKISMGPVPWGNNNNNNNNLFAWILQDTLESVMSN